MNEKDIQRIESELSVKLPDSYIQAVLEYPLSGTDNEDWEFCNEADAVISANKEIRELGFFGKTWPKLFFILGFDGCGNYYFLNLDNKDVRVYFADHEAMFDPNDLEALEVSYDSIEVYIDFVKEIEAENRLEKLKQNTKRWWQFWK